MGWRGGGSEGVITSFLQFLSLFVEHILFELANLKKIDIAYFFLNQNKPELFAIFSTLIKKCSGDEVLSVNGRSVQGLSHEQAISEFRNIRVGEVLIHLARRNIQKRYVHLRKIQKA